MKNDIIRVSGRKRFKPIGSNPPRGMPPPMSLLAKQRMGINEDCNHSEKDAENGTKTWIQNNKALI